MTRWARSSTSKASNKKTLEEATPWETMVKKMKSQPNSESAESDANAEEEDSEDSQDQETQEVPKLKNSPLIRPFKRSKKGRKSEEVERKKFFFEGSWVSAETKATLERLREEMKDADDPAARKKLESTIRQVRRNEEKRNKRLKLKRCFRCRSTDHQLSECPETDLPNTSQKQSSLVGGATSGVCFRCGESNHAARNCRAKVEAKGKYPFATCFVCGQMGHISSECDQNARGIYPRGGCCRLCGSVKHLRRDCPGLRKTGWDGLGMDRSESNKTVKVAPKPKKIIKF